MVGVVEDKEGEEVEVGMAEHEETGIVDDGSLIVDRPGLDVVGGSY